MFSIRINTLKTTRENFKKQLESLSISYEEVSWYEDALIIRGIEKRAFMDLPLYQEGLAYVQNLSSFIPVLVLDPKPGEHILDICAAPGGKTMHIATNLKDDGEVVANDISRTRLFKTKALLAQYGVTNVRLSQGRAEHLWKKYEGQFDKVLVDAPCSMGEHLSPKELKSLGKRQQYILRSAIACAKEGGRIVYSTCTLTKQENEDVLDWIFEKEEGIEIEHINPPQELSTFLTQEGTLKVEKDDLFEPFFVASLIKKLL